MKSKVLLILSVMVASVACAEDDTCDEGMQKLGDGTCAAGAGSGGSGGSSSANDEGFGASCTDHADCRGETSYCATPPGAPAYCTAPGCDADPGLCPDRWICFDVSQVVPGEPWICAPPA